MLGTLHIVFAVLLASGTAGLIISCLRAPLWDSECEFLYQADAEGIPPRDGSGRRAESGKQEET